MHILTEHVSRLEKIMETTIRLNPHAKDIISSFKPLILKKEQLVDTILLEGDDTLTFDEALFKQGVPLVEQNAFFHEDDPFAQVCISYFPALKKAFPKLVAVWEILENQILNQSIDMKDLFMQNQQDRDELIKKWAAQVNTEPQIIYFIMNMVIKTILKKRAQNWEALIKEFFWDKGYCPVCGALPNIAWIQEANFQRWLHCSQCAHEWTFSRVICPCCGNNEQESMTYFYIENRKMESTFVCEKCKRYLITLNNINELFDYDADILALGLTHMDLIMQEKGYQSMSEPEWGFFS